MPRRKKNSSQSSLGTDDPTTSSFGESTKGGFLKRYRKAKNSINDLTAMNEKDINHLDDNKSTASSAKSDEKVGFLYTMETHSKFLGNGIYGWYSKC